MGKPTIYEKLSGEVRVESVWKSTLCKCQELHAGGLCCNILWEYGYTAEFDYW